MAEKVKDRVSCNGGQPPKADCVRCETCAHCIQDPDGLLCLEALQITVARAWCPRWKLKRRNDNGKPEL